MPSSTPKQARFMAAVAHGWKPTQKGVKAPPLKVAKEFTAADKGSEMLSKGMKGRKKRKGYQGGGIVGALQEARSRQGAAPQGIIGGNTGIGNPVSGALSGPVSGFPVSPAGYPQNRDSGALRTATGFPGGVRRPQGLGAPQSGFQGRGSGPGGGNAALRTADAVSGAAGDRLNRMQSGLDNMRSPGGIQRQLPGRGGIQRRTIMAKGGKVGKIQSIFDRFNKDDYLMEDRREYDVEDLMQSEDLTEQEAQQLFNKIQKLFRPDQKQKGGKVAGVGNVFHILAKRLRESSLTTEWTDDPEMIEMFEADAKTADRIGDLAGRGTRQSLRAAKKAYDNQDTAARDAFYDLLDPDQISEAESVLEYIGSEWEPATKRPPGGGFAGGGKVGKMKGAFSYWDKIGHHAESDLPVDPAELKTNQKLWAMDQAENLGVSVEKFLRDVRAAKEGGDEGFAKGGKVDALARLADKLDDLRSKEAPSAEVDALSSEIENLEPGAVERMTRSINRGQPARGAISQSGMAGRQSYQLGLEKGRQNTPGGIRRQIEEYLMLGHWSKEDAREMAGQFEIIGKPEAFDPEGGIPHRVTIEADEDLMDAFITAAESD